MVGGDEHAVMSGRPERPLELGYPLGDLWPGRRGRRGKVVADGVVIGERHGALDVVLLDVGEAPKDDRAATFGAERELPVVNADECPELFQVPPAVGCRDEPPPGS
jgi:hypothetical protein